MLPVRALSHFPAVAPSTGVLAVNTATFPNRFTVPQKCGATITAEDVQARLAPHAGLDRAAAGILGPVALVRRAAGRGAERRRRQVDAADRRDRGPSGGRPASIPGAAAPVARPPGWYATKRSYHEI